MDIFYGLHIFNTELKTTNKIYKYDFNRKFFK